MDLYLCIAQNIFFRLKCSLHLEKDGPYKLFTEKLFGSSFALL